MGGPEASDVTTWSATSKVTIITAVARHSDPLSADARKGELMESNMDAMEACRLLVLDRLVVSALGIQAQ